MAKNLPHSLDAERSVLGAVFLNPALANALTDELRAVDFFDPIHGYIFEAIDALNKEKKAIDYSSVSGKLDQMGKLEEVGGIQTLIELSNYTVALDHLETYIDLVRSFSLKREVIKVTQNIATQGLTTDIETDEYLEEAERLIFELSKKRKAGDFKPLKEVVQAIQEKLTFLQSHKGGITGLTTGFLKLDQYINGLQKEEFIILAARPSVGKSAFAIQLALNAAMKNKDGKAGVAFFSLEMSNEQLVTRMISNMANIENSKLRTGFLTSQEWKQFEAYSERLNRLNIFFDDSASSNLSDIRAKCRKLAQEGKLDLIVIDYLQLIHIDARTQSRQEEVSRISRSLKQLARELSVPVIALSQLSRDVERSSDKRPLLSHLRESGSIEQDADIVMFIHRDEYYEREKSDAGDTEIIVAKNRQGRTGTIHFIFSANYSRFLERSDREE
ncbi:replicative DNA helicase [Acholeplasma equifetale]|uniref:replicative DNA helicase n=1 Tax=Acholeplasma equifetale TaxID=264634 RepID=UPI00047BA530|nr:replicative DNA helicase [Acholeplasma equifetale]